MAMPPKLTSNLVCVCVFMYFYCVFGVFGVCLVCNLGRRVFPVPVDGRVIDFSIIFCF